MKKSDPGFYKVFELNNRLAMLQSPQRWFNLANEEVPYPERKAAIASTLYELEGALEDYALLKEVTNIENW